MASNSRKKTATFLGATIIAFIIISFMFSGYQSSRGGGNPDTIAKIGKYPIKQREFSMEYERQLRFYKQILGGKDLTSAQIQRFNIKSAAIKSLSQRKLMLLLAEEIGINPSQKEIGDEISKLPYFQTNGQFDLSLYKRLLTQNRYSPTEFEQDFSHDLRQKSLTKVLQEVPLSQNYTNDLENFRAQQFNASMVRYPKSSLKNLIKVTSRQVNNFLKDPKNRARAESIFIENKSKYDKSEEVLARHILIKGDDAEKKINEIRKKVTPQNFATIANKETHDPSGKGKGGSLGWFTRGKMVPEFEAIAFKLKPGTISNPVKTPFGQHIILVEKRKNSISAKFADHKKSIAKELIKSNQHPQIEKLSKQLTAQIKKAISKNNIAVLKGLKKKYNLTYDTNKSINRLDGATGTVQLKPAQLKQIFTSKAAKTFVFDNPIEVTIVKTKKMKSKSKKNKKDNLGYVLAQKIQQDIIKIMSDKYQTKVFIPLNQ